MMMMQTAARPLGIAPVRRLPRLQGRLRLSRRRLFTAILVLAAVLLGSTGLSTLAHLRLPDPTGSFAVGKLDGVLVDRARREGATTATDDFRHVRVVAWYPAVAGTGEPAAYLADLDSIADGLIASGEVGTLEVAGLGMIVDPARAGADVAGESTRYPVVLLSPGNATNVEFYSSLAEDLASHGYVVIGLDHPYQVAAVQIDEVVATYAGDPPPAQAERVIPARIDERVADIGFVLDRLQRDAAGLTQLADRLDLTHIGILGHSNGGIAAAEACADARIDACVNVDGQHAGGPFSSRQAPSAPTKPFMFLTKETELHPALAELFEGGGPDTVRVVIPAAAHDQFADPAMFRPRLLPFDGTADDVVTVARGFSLAFFDRTLRDAPQERFGSVNAPTDVLVFVYPLAPR